MDNLEPLHVNEVTPRDRTGRKVFVAFVDVAVEALLGGRDVVVTPRSRGGDDQRPAGGAAGTFSKERPRFNIPLW